MTPIWTGFTLTSVFITYLKDNEYQEVTVLHNKAFQALNNISCDGRFSTHIPEGNFEYLHGNISSVYDSALEYCQNYTCYGAVRSTLDVFSRALCHVDSKTVDYMVVTHLCLVYRAQFEQ
jgi:hypothetical protein